MPETGTWKHPYPLGTTSPPKVHMDLKALAESAERADNELAANINKLAAINVAGLPFATAAGIVNTPVGAGTGIDIKTVTVTFPAGRFTVPPIVTTGLDATGTAFAAIADFTVKVSNVTATQMSVTVLGDGTSLTQDVPFKVHWHAVQMKTNAAAG